MIIDTLDNLKNSESLNQLISVVVDYIGEHDLYDLAVGKHSIVGEKTHMSTCRWPRVKKKTRPSLNTTAR